MKSSRGYTFSSLLVAFLFLTNNPTNAQISKANELFISNDTPIFRPDYSKLKIDTVTIKLISTAAFSEYSYNKQTTKRYDEFGRLTFIEETYFTYTDLYTKSKTFWKQNFFEYDENNRFKKVTYKADSTRFGKSAFSIHISKGNLKKNGGFLPDYYEDALDNNKGNYILLQITDIFYFYDAKGKLAKQIIPFTIIYSGDNIRGKNLKTIIGNGRNQALDTIILKSDFLISAKSYTDPPQNKSRYIERRYVNCNNRDLNNKWFWNQPLESFLCPKSQPKDSTTKIPRNYYTDCESRFSIYDKQNRLVLSKFICEFSSEEFLCTTINSIGSLTKYSYKEDDTPESEIDYTIYRLKYEKDLKPFCTGTDQLMFDLPDDFFVLKNAARKYFYSSNGLLEREEFTRQNYSIKAYRECSQPCFPKDTSRNLNEITYYHYTFHPKP